MSAHVTRVARPVVVAAAAGAAAAGSQVANTDYQPEWLVLGSADVDEAIAQLTPEGAAGALMGLGSELARDSRVQAAIAERIGLCSPALIALPAEEAESEILLRLRAELTSMNDELAEQHDLNNELLVDNTRLRGENSELWRVVVSAGDDDDDDEAVLVEDVDAAADRRADADADAATVEPAEVAAPTATAAAAAPSEEEDAEGADAAADGEKAAAADGDGGDDGEAERLMQAAIGVAAIIVLFAVFRKVSPGRAQRIGKVCTAVLVGAWTWVKGGGAAAAGGRR